MPEDIQDATPGLGRRTFLAYLVASTTVVAAAELGAGWFRPASAVVPSPPQIPEQYDLNDLLTDAARPTSNLITVVVNEDGTASFALPRAEVGQGIVTSTAMLIAEELDLPLSKVNVTLADARPGAGLEPADRRLQHHHLDLHPGPGRGRRGAAGARPGSRRASWAPRSTS